MIGDREMDRLLFLSRLRLEPEERQRLSGQIQDIIEYVELLQEYDTSGVDIDLASDNRPKDLRDDVVREGLGSDSIETFAVERNEGYFVVPRILDQE